MTKKLFIFDADETLWHSDGKDYISSQVSKLDKFDRLTIVRLVDGQKFYLDKDATSLFKKISAKGYYIGVVSDNKKPMVVKALKLFGLWLYVNKKAVNVKLWQGYCPKHLMINEIIDKMKIDNKKSVYWFDDKNYVNEAAIVGVNFIRISGSFLLKKAILSVMKS
jgi:predicted phosphatase